MNTTHQMNVAIPNSTGFIGMASLECALKWEQIFFFIFSSGFLNSFCHFHKRVFTVPKKKPGIRSERNFNSSFIGLCEVHWPSTYTYTRYSLSCSVRIVRRQIGQMVDVCGRWWVWNHWCEKSCASFHFAPSFDVLANAKPPNAIF